MMGNTSILIHALSNTESQFHNYTGNQWCQLPLNVCQTGIVTQEFSHTTNNGRVVLNNELPLPADEQLGSGGSVPFHFKGNKAFPFEEESNVPRS